MSKITQPRVKQIRQKDSSGQYASIPIGAGGFLIDMISNLDLEEELRLGGNHYVEIQDSEVTQDGETIEQTNIKEWYFTEEKGDRTIAQMSDEYLITYSAQITITDNTITMSLYEKDIVPENKLHEKIINIIETSTLTSINEEVE